jgi:hypothetical protein
MFLLLNSHILSELDVVYNARLTVNDSAYIYALGNIRIHTKLNRDYQKLTPRYF